MSNLRVNSVTPRTTSEVDIQGLNPPTFNGSPLSIESSVATRFANLNGNTISANQPNTSRFTSTSVSGQIYEILFAIESALGIGATTNTIEVLFAKLMKQGHPVGQIIQGPWATAPEGSIALQGQLVNRSAYPALYNLAITTADLIVGEGLWSNNKALFSSGNGTTTFRLPDYRGLFLRAGDLGAGIDTGRVLNTGAFGAGKSDVTSLPPGSGAFNLGDGPSTSNFGADGKGPTNGYSFDASRVVRTSNETRPVNVALLTCMYY